MTRAHHRGDPRADVELLQGVFPGCCQAGVADALWVPGSGEAGRFPKELTLLVAETRAREAGPPDPRPYSVRERLSGLRAEGLGCAYLGERGCRLGELRAPLCLCYLCEPVREALAEAAGGAHLGSGTDDLAGSQEALRAVVGGSEDEAAGGVAALEGRIEALDRALTARTGSGRALFEAWQGRRGGARCAVAPQEGRRASG